MGVAFAIIVCCFLEQCLKKRQALQKVNKVQLQEAQRQASIPQS